MNIVFVARSCHPNTNGWIEGLRHLGHDVRFVANLDTPKTPHDAVDVIIVPPVRWLSRFLKRTLRLDSALKVEIPRPLRLWKALASPRPDLVVLKTQGLSTVIASLMARGMGARRLLWTNLTPARARAWRLLSATGAVPRRFLYTTSPHVPPRHARHLPYAVTSAEPERSAATTARFLTVSDFRSIRKQTWWTLEAAARGGLLDGRARFTFVGTGDAGDVGIQRLTSLIDDHEIGHLVDVVRNVPHQQMNDVYASHDVLVLPSRREPFGMAVFEAMSQGLYVIVSDDAGVAPSVVASGGGAVFPAGDIDALTAAMVWAATAGDDRERMGAAGRSWIASRASPRACAREILELAGLG